MVQLMQHRKLPIVCIFCILHKYIGLKVVHRRQFKYNSTNNNTLDDTIDHLLLFVSKKEKMYVFFNRKNKVFFVLLMQAFIYCFCLCEWFLIVCILYRFCDQILIIQYLYQYKILIVLYVPLIPYANNSVCTGNWIRAFEVSSFSC